MAHLQLSFLLKPSVVFMYVSGQSRECFTSCIPWPHTLVNGEPHTFVNGVVLCLVSCVVVFLDFGPVWKLLL